MAAEQKNVEDFRASMLAWYDAHRRPLPWRVAPAEAPNPYFVWLSEIMAQQTTIPAVLPYFSKFTKKWPSIHELAAAAPDDVMQAWAGLGYYARARNLHKCAQFVSGQLDGVFPDTQNALKELPGVGDYTANAIATMAFGKMGNVVDANVERVMARLFAVSEPLPDCKPQLKTLAGQLSKGEATRPGDYAQSLMELGALVCTPTSPKCLVCPVRSHCTGYEMGIAANLPTRRIKAAKPQKHGYVYWITAPDGRILFERRGEKGLLGGTIGLPTSAWVEKSTKRAHLPLKSPKETKIMVKHGFTHFDLELHGFAASHDGDGVPEDGTYFWATPQEAITLGIPTLFKKALKQFI